jgi:hypothetical protein
MVMQGWWGRRAEENVGAGVGVGVGVRRGKHLFPTFSHL